MLRDDGSQIEFPDLIHNLPIAGKRIDPGDCEAYRAESGLKVTCDGPEAEIATPPIELSPGFVGRAAAWTGLGGHSLVGLLAGRFELEGVSTHISVSVENNLATRAAGLFSRTFAPALMLLMDGDNSPGLLVRPRHSRLEFGGEFVAGSQLSAALALAAGGAIVCEQAASSYRAKADLPPPVRVKVVPAVDRYGWYVARDAFGFDLYQRGRASVFRREFFGKITAQECLEESWSAARTALGSSVAPGDLEAADDIIAGRAELPLESGLDTSPPATTYVPEPIALGQAMLDIKTPRFMLAATATTWDFTLFTATNGAGRPVHVSVPTPMLGDFLNDAARGDHDDAISSASASQAAERTLDNYHEATAFGMWDAVEFTHRLAPPERRSDGVER